MLKNREIFGFLDFFVYLCSTMIKNEVMTQEEKQLLLKDLCARLPYDVMINYESHIYILNEIDPSCKDIDYITVRIQDVERLMCAESVILESIKPYLRPLSSMTEEEKKELLKFGAVNRLSTGEVVDVSCVGFDRHCDVQDWLNSRHLDYRGLIPMGLAIAVTEENNPYKE